jgi:O-antigen/teichoic acid export membrane protein
LRWNKLSLILALALLFPFAFPAQAQEPIPIYYAGPEGKTRTALKLAGIFSFVTDPSQADVIFLNGTLPDPAAISERVKEGAGLILFLGPDIAPEELEAFWGQRLALSRRDDPLSLYAVPELDDPLAKEIIWASAPQVRERFVVEGWPVEPLVVGFEDKSLVLGKANLGQGEVYVFCVFLDGLNPQFQDWAYFNYFIYHLAVRAAGGKPSSFADYPASPVPHTRERAIILAIMAFILITAGVAFWLVRCYSLSHPELLGELLASPEAFKAREAETPWEEIGFHRPLGGFLVAFMMGLILFIPFILYQNFVLPVFILPSAQALGIWGRVTQFFNLIWLLFDLGTSTAFIKFFSQYRVRNPQLAIQYGQVFVWWQALSGAFQVAVVTLIASIIVPRSAYALYSWSIIIHTLIQIPGFYQVIRHAFMGWQRFDYAQYLDIALSLIFPMVTQPILVSAMVAWGRANPVFGGAMGGVMGLGIAGYASELLTFLLGLWLYRRLGYNARLLFLAHFDLSVLKEAFRFGLFEMLGSIAWAVGQAMEILITQARLVNYAEVWGNWVIAQNFIFAYQVLHTLYGNLMSSISEAISHGRRILSQYYSVMAYKWGGFISAFVGAVLLAVADRFILGATGPEFTRAAAYVIPLIFWGAIQYPSWVGDYVQLASNRPYLKFAMVGGEQIIRILLAFLLLERFQIYALIIAYFVALFSKDVATYFISHRLCFPQRFYFWQSLWAPILAGAAHYFLLRWVTGLIWRGDPITSVVIFLVGILFSYPVFAFFYGLFGGWDQRTLGELGLGAEITGMMKPFAKLFWASSAFGARISPIHNLFPITIYESALAEARSLSLEKVKLTE